MQHLEVMDDRMLIEMDKIAPVSAHFAKILNAILCYATIWSVDKEKGDKTDRKAWKTCYHAAES